MSVAVASMLFEKWNFRDHGHFVRKYDGRKVALLILSCIVEPRGIVD